ncbi:RNA polymerase sigma factor [Qiania dongpingensis]|uniref:Sigma-70 family RNA polymerase sigma factor n=1 Tax=Qiania dongpingensis TaxID=2763669 RepID=A0A7G9G3S6_9FIRM|nr:sigma-70 family RNA polymerase sigma factor [Qiania dongpingensis]QNM05458.1 sigma-70 family RNA polymerase sigma factor [Qiania dongpingensis]
MTPDKELQLILDLKSHKKHALQLCISLYYKYVSYIVENIIGKSLSKEDKEEAVADVFISLWRHTDHINPEQYQTLKPYLGSIARNISKNALREFRTENHLSFDESIIIHAPEQLLDSVILQELADTLKNVLSLLSEEERICFIKYYYYRKTIRSISEETGIGESSIKSKLYRGRKKLRDLLKERGIDYENYEDIL